MKKIIITIIPILFAITLWGQEFGNAILLDKEELSGKYEKIIWDEFKKKFHTNNKTYSEVYTWDGKSTSKPIPYPAFDNPTKNSARPITKVIRLEANFSADEKCNAGYNTDTLGNTTKMWLYLNVHTDPKYKIVDLSTSLIESMASLRTRTTGIQKAGPGQLTIKDFKSYFGGSDPQKLKKDKPETYKKYLEGLLKAKKKEIVAIYTKRAKETGAELVTIAGILNGNLDKKIWKLTNHELDDKGKLSRIVIDATAADNFPKWDVLGVYEKKIFGKLQQYDRLAYISVMDTLPDMVKAKPIYFSKKKIKAAIDAKADLIFVRNENLIKELNRDKDAPTKRVQIKGNQEYLEKLLLRVPNIKLVERNYDGPTEFFTSQYKDEKFIDFDMSAIQGKQIGAEYVFEKNEVGIKATEVATGKISAIEQEKGKGLGKKIFGNSYTQLLNMVMDILDEDIEIIEILKQKKGKINKLLAYNVFTFDAISVFKILRLHEEKVGGRTITREEEIGKARLSKAITTTIGEMKIAKGEKALFEAIENGDKIRFVVN